MIYTSELINTSKIKMQLKEIQTQEDIAKTFTVLLQIYEKLDEENYVENILNMMQNGYRMAGVFESDNLCIGVVGIKITHKISLGKSIEIEDFMIHRQRRGIGVGKILLKWVDWQAFNFECDNIVGNLQTARKESQKIFAREKFIIDGFSFKKEC